MADAPMAFSKLDDGLDKNSFIAVMLGYFGIFSGVAIGFSNPIGWGLMLTGVTSSGGFLYANTLFMSDIDLIKELAAKHNKMSHEELYGVTLADDRLQYLHHYRHKLQYYIKQAVDGNEMPNSVANILATSLYQFFDREKGEIAKDFLYAYLYAAVALMVGTAAFVCTGGPVGLAICAAVVGALCLSMQVHRDTILIARTVELDKGLSDDALMAKILPQLFLMHHFRSSVLAYIKLVKEDKPLPFSLTLFIAGRMLSSFCEQVTKVADKVQTTLVDVSSSLFGGNKSISGIDDSQTSLLSTTSVVTNCDL